MIAADGQADSSARFAGEQGSGGAADARERHPGAAQAAFQGDDRFPALPVAANMLAQDFSPSAPNQVWTADIT